MQQGPVTAETSSLNHAAEGQPSHECAATPQFASRRGIRRGSHPIRATRRTGGILAAAALSLFVCGTVRATQSASLAWTPPSSSGTIGYALYIGSQTGVYSTRLDVGTNTTITLTGLKEGQTNYFSVTAYNAARMESPLSSEVVYLVPGLARLTRSAQAGSPASLSFPVAIGHTYSVMASTDLKNWSLVYTTLPALSNTWITWQDPQASSYKSRFYRLILN